MSALNCDFMSSSNVGSTTLSQPTGVVIFIFIYFSIENREHKRTEKTFKKGLKDKPE